jgi:protein tyrosine phosphatase
MGFVSAMMSLPMAKGMLLFNAGTKPHIVYRQAGSSRTGLTALLRRLLSEAEEELRKRGSDEGLRS